MQALSLPWESSPQWCSWRGQFMVLGHSAGPYADSPQLLGSEVHCPAWADGSLWRSDRSFRNYSTGNQ
jgi:hypothetical protein